MKYAEKLRQANREALAAVIALAGTIIVWALLGFGVARTGIVVFSTPLWVITGCFGTVIFAIALVVIMTKYVMKDVGLDDDDAGDEAGGSAPHGR